MNIKIGVIGLGYVGLPLALAFAKKFPNTVGFDLNKEKVLRLQQGTDETCEGLEPVLRETSLQMSSDASVLEGCNFFVVGVPTPVDENHNPDLTPLISACDTVGKYLRKAGIVCFESTVYPGLTEDICGPRLEKASGLRRGRDFKLAYSPERINPGDKEHTLESILKIVSAEDGASLDIVAQVYGSVITAGVYRAPSIKVAEAAKVIENTQRDLNIALMNELSIIFDKIGISTRQVLEAAGTKWNFLRFSPGLVGGHCIGVDPYYLTTKAELHGYHPQVILAGRRINDGMGAYVAQKVVKLMINEGIQCKGARVGVLGLTFKENVADIRNSRVPDIINELRAFGADVMIHDPLANPDHAKHEYGLNLVDQDELRDLDALILAVSHRQYLEIPITRLCAGLKPKAIFADVKSAISPSNVPERVTYWSL